MKTTPLLLIVLIFYCTPAFSAPATMPTTAPATETLMQGDIVFVPPEGWKLAVKSNNGRLAAYSRAEPKATLVVNVDPQQTALDQSAAPKIGAMLLTQANNNAAREHLEFLLKPKIEKDDRYFLRIHQRYKKETQTCDQVQIYRVIGKNLVAVATTVFTESADEATKVFGEAEKTLSSVRTSKQMPPSAAAPKTKPATRPTALPQAKIAFSAPAGWSAETNDNASGIVANYHDPVEGFNTIVISVRPLPPEAKKDPKLRDALVDEIVSGEKAQFKFDGANVVGQTEIVKDNRFLRKERTRYEAPDHKIVVTARQLRIGDVVVSVAMACLEAAAVDDDRLADEVALTLKPAGR